MNQNRSARRPSRSVDDKLDRPRALVTDGFSRRDRSGSHRRAHLVGHPRRGRFLDDFLMAALQRTVAFVQMYCAFTIAKDLNFDMPGFLHVFFDQNRIVAKRARGLIFGRLQCVGKIARAFNQPHAFAATAGHRLDQHRIANAVPACARQMAPRS